LNALEFDAKPRRLLLELRGIDYDGPPSVGYDIYVNLPKSTAPDPKSMYFVGTLSLFGVKHGTHHDETAVQRFDITGIARHEGFDPKRLSVTIVPFDLFVPRLKDAPPLRRSGTLGLGRWLSSWRRGKHPNEPWYAGRLTSDWSGRRLTRRPFGSRGRGRSTACR
jgi:hypothetical protein